MIHLDLSQWKHENWPELWGDHPLLGLRPSSRVSLPEKF